MSDLELYQHFVDYVFEVHRDGNCFVRRFDYDAFTKCLPINDAEDYFDAVITSDGDLCFNIEDVLHFFDDFDTFKDLFMRQFEKGGEK